jgi:bifunctional DNA-binding transcriptional regulator/antitoxin component of YhaV-PrlF toxin-antitoxin module
MPDAFVRMQQISLPIQSDPPVRTKPTPHFMQICITIKTEQEEAMAMLTVTARGQVTFRKEVLQHLGVKPGEKISLELLPGGTAKVHAAKPTGSIQDFFGCLAGKSNVKLTIEEINEAIAEAGAEAGMAGLER